MSEEEKQEGARPEGARAEGAQPEGVRAEGAQPEGVRAEGARPKAEEKKQTEGSPAEAEAPVRRKETDEEKAARRKAAFEAREAAKAAAAMAAAQAAKEAANAAASAPAAAHSAAPGAASADGQAPPGAPGAASPGAAAGAAPGSSRPGVAADAAPPPPPPSPNRPRLDRAVQLLRELVAEDAVEEAEINEPNDHLPTIVVKNERWSEAARLFRSHPELNTNYLRNVSGVDHETHMEVVYHLLSLDSGHGYALKVRTDRDTPQVASATPVWQTANWNEREIYDLLGIDFPGHPDLRRIMMPDDWVGHPLRKDYAPLDSEV
ncbi:NADH-quinone oxidoreductase subunit C [Cohnella fermenti]|uniref:NADH-quinone oxidoreductase subunit C n=1 Tax=Cohnella fermenti TaxID=2565925 RepID=A0A4S4BFM7_9BACL|nr:NADH-quinone oxidoreductase subunit C [Cohnella fermenti]THF73149.1 NADH-quinone oxidoreductase subunit C [Cohnella fermenti]